MNRRQILRLLGCGTLANAIAVPSATAANLVKWGYVGANSPEHWGELSPEFQLCQRGRHQTPIDISATTTVESAALRLNYRATLLSIKNTDRTIQVNYAPGSFLTFQRETFQLLQFHFHHPSEHRLNGQRFDLEIHLVHRAASGKLAVVSVMAQVGDFNARLQPIWAAMPTQPSTVKVPATFDITHLLPRDRTFYEYSGSLSTPPCSEQVLWFVMAQPIQVSAQQVQQFAALFPNNARPLQPLGDRRIKQSM